MLGQYKIIFSCLFSLHSPKRTKQIVWDNHFDCWTKNPFLQQLFTGCQSINTSQGQVL